MDLLVSGAVIFAISAVLFWYCCRVAERLTVLWGPNWNRILPSRSALA
jgi:hypothetical protein